MNMGWRRSKIKQASASWIPWLFILILTLPVEAQLTFTTNDGALTITGYTGPAGALVIPSMIDGYSVTSIGMNAFNSRTDLTSITIAENVTNIGSGAFLGTGLTGVSFGDHLVSIGGFAFAGSGLTNVAIPASVTFIGAESLSASPLVAITVDALNPVYSSGDGVLFDKPQFTLIKYPPGKVGSYGIPNGVTNVEHFAFASARLTSVNVPASVARIGTRAFIDCSSLTNAVVGEGTTSIGPEAFTACASLTAITVDALNPVYSSVDGVLFDKPQTTLLQYPGGRTGSVVISQNVTQIGASAFSNSKVTDVVVPANVTNIEDSAFAKSAKLSGVYFRGDAPAPGGRVFFSDNNVTVYYLPGTTGWGSTFAGIPAALWVLSNPLILSNGSTFAVLSNGFSFIVSWATNALVVVEASTSLTNPVWSPLTTNSLTNGSFYFSDLGWTNSPARFYRLRSVL